MKGKLIKKAAAAAFSVLLASGIMFVPPAADMFGGGMTVTVRAAEAIDGLDYNENENYYEISTLTQLNAFIAYANGLNSDDACKGMTFKLTADIGSDENPVGVITPVYRFAGNFDGDGHTINGIIINSGYEYSSDKISVGLFCNCYGDIIKNLTLKNITVDTTANGKKAIDVGGICGWGNCSIRNCHVTGTINGRMYVGGIMGMGGSAIATISGCSFSGIVNAIYNPFGGIIGISSCPISDCTVTNAELNGESYAGGIAGIVTGYSPSVTNCKAANVSITTTTTEVDPKKNTGALVGGYGLSKIIPANISGCVYENVNGALAAIGMCKVNDAETTNYDGDSVRRYTVHCGENVTATYISGTTYDVGGVTCYAGGAKLTISNTAPVGRVFKKYVVKDGLGNDITDTALSGTTLTMPENTSVVVTAEFETPTIAETETPLIGTNLSYCTDYTNNKVYILYKFTPADERTVADYDYIQIINKTITDTTSPDYIIKPTNESSYINKDTGFINTVFSSVKFNDDSVINAGTGSYIVGIVLNDTTDAPNTEKFDFEAVPKYEIGEGQGGAGD